MDDETAKKLTNIHTQLAAVFSDEPGWLYSIEVSGLGAGQNLLYIYDGQDATGNLVSIIQSIQYDTIPIVYKHPKRFAKGLYVAWGVGSGIVNGQWLTGN